MIISFSRKTLLHGVSYFYRSAPKENHMINILNVGN